METKNFNGLGNYRELRETDPETLTVLCTLKDCWNNQVVRQI